jgi:hypothetical protein
MERKEWESLINIPYGPVTFTYKNGTNFRYSNTTYDFYFTFTNPIPLGGYIQLNLNDQFTSI